MQGRQLPCIWIRKEVTQTTLSAREDFAETFMLFVKHKGIIPRQICEETYDREEVEGRGGNRQACCRGKVTRR